MNKLTLMVLVLFFVPLATALTIQEPVEGFKYYDSLVNVNVTWNDPSIGNCTYAINHQHNVSIPCQSEFIVDVPYDSGDTSFSFYQNAHSGQVNFNVDNNFTSDKGIILGFQMLLPFLLTLLLWALAFKMDSGTDTGKEGNENDLVVAGKNALRLFLILFGFVFTWSSLNTLNLAVRSYIHSELILGVVNKLSFLYGWLFWIILIYIVINFFITAIYSIGNTMRK